MIKIGKDNNECKKILLDECLNNDYMQGWISSNGTIYQKDSIYTQSHNQILSTVFDDMNIDYDKFNNISEIYFLL